MKTKVIEVTNGFNRDKLLVGRLDDESWLRSALPSKVDAPPLTQLEWAHDEL